jgi:hypothetical protein
VISSRYSLAKFMPPAGLFRFQLPKLHGSLARVDRAVDRRQGSLSPQRNL